MIPKEAIKVAKRLRRTEPCDWDVDDIDYIARALLAAHERERVIEHKYAELLKQANRKEVVPNEPGPRLHNATAPVNAAGASAPMVSDVGVDWVLNNRKDPIELELAADLRDARAEIERLTAGGWNAAMNYAGEVSTLEARIAKLRGALEHYGCDPEKCQRILGGWRNGECTRGDDCGKIAYGALRQDEGGATAFTQERKPT